MVEKTKETVTCAAKQYTKYKRFNSKSGKRTQKCIIIRGLQKLFHFVL